MSLSVEDRKELGAYYTDARVAAYLVGWAVRNGSDCILEPSIGDGVFVAQAVDRLAGLGGGPEQIAGVDLDASAVAAVAGRVPGVNLTCSDFFALDPNALGQFDAVVGNPPFVRYQRFGGSARARALRRSKEAGVRLSALTSAWAPFLAHALQFLRPGGRMAVVAPIELTYAKYARPLLAKLGASFSSLRILEFDRPLFAEINERTVLLLADGFGGRTSELAVCRLASADALAAPEAWAQTHLPIAGFLTGDGNTAVVELTAHASALIEELRAHAGVRQLGDLAEITIGYVTGDNAYFHPSAEAIAQWRLPASVLRWSVRKGSDLNACGLALTTDDLDELNQAGPHALFCPDNDPFLPVVRAYIQHGERESVHLRYKCRVRTPWYSVPGVRVPDMVLSVLANAGPRLVANEAAAVATNSVLVLKLQGDAPRAQAMAACALTTYAQLEAELAGHALGGGALKFEPAEARRWRLPVVEPDSTGLAAIDGLLRSGRLSEAQELADRLVLVDGLGLDVAQLGTLRASLAVLRSLRRKKRSVSVVHV